MPSTRKSSAYFASPVTLAMTSCGMKSRPRCLRATMDLRGVAGRKHDGAQVVVIGTAAAQVARHGMPGLLARGAGILLQPGHGGDHLAGCAEAALRPQLVDEGLLHGVKRAIRTTQAFHRHDLAAAHAMGERGAGVVGGAIDHHGARAALGAIATQLGSRETELVA